ncbi:histidinol dehydrogenase [Alistipes sp. CAG:514]|nr:histidinol dehydrogenase [Alistipes sp. CAG:514]
MNELFSMVNKYVNPSRGEWRRLTERPAKDDPAVLASVEATLEDVRKRGDDAVLDLEARFDGVAFPSPSDLKVSDEEIAEAAEAVPDELKKAIAQAYSNIRRFHEAQMPGVVRVETSPGVVCVQKAVPVRRVGLYVPGGSAPLFSSVLMLAVPARVAGCGEIVLCTPPDKKGKANPAIVYTASFCGVKDIFKIGGAQAIAAMAYGTRTLARCDKIYGPGNRYVMKAKQMVGLSVAAIDMPAGPSEVMVLADGTADPEFVAADFLSQSEHGPDSQSILVCTSEAIAKSVVDAVARQTARLSRGSIIAKALDHSRMVVLTNREDIIDFANEYAPEHLIISMRDPWSVADKVVAAGSIFIGNYSPESAGDYASGTNHTLPTSGWARSFSGLNLDAFMRKMTIQEISREGLSGLGDTIRTMALAEGLDAHAAAVEVRLEK